MGSLSKRKIIMCCNCWTKRDYLEFDDERSGGFAFCEIGNKLTEAEQALVREIAEEVWG